MFKQKFKNLAELTSYFPDDQSCREYLEKQRWNGKPVCPHCQNDTVYKFADGKHYKCKSCRRKFTVLIGTIFEDTKIPLRKWFIAIYIFISHKKGISSCQLAKDLGVTQKTAWHLLHRIRYAFGIAEPEQLEDTVEVDETYIGGKAKNMHKSVKEKKIKGRGSSGKAAVLGLVERNGRVFARPVDKVDSNTLQSIVRSKVEKGANIMTDEFLSYTGLGLDYNHKTVTHSEGEYVRYETGGHIHTGTIDGFWSLLKRGIYGIYHQVSKKHLHRYCTEFDFRYNSRKSGETPRFDNVLSECNGRLMYKTLITKDLNEQKE
ncbi:MAG TPA: IS1595 family transposase [Pyrinomonadaceae bacterium]|nr:IS1595 family transposase [Pyrinomonadaceae bacterium]